MSIFNLIKRSTIATGTLSLISLFIGSKALASSSINSTTPGSPVTPSLVDAYLAPDDPVTFDVFVDVGAPSALDLFLLNDLSGSFRDDLPNVQNSIPNLISNMNGISSDVMYGLGSFVDKPISPFGGFSDYVYNTELALTNNTQDFQSAVNSLGIFGGSDAPESQLEALMQAALRKDEIGWRDDAFSVIVLQTDATYHKAGDGVSRGLTPNNGDAVVNPGEDYPGTEQVKNILLDANIIPIFAVAGSPKSEYEALVDDWGFGSVVSLDSDSSNLVDAIKEGLDAVLNDVKLVVEDDDFDYVQQIASDISGKKTGIDKDVPSGEKAQFSVTLEDLSGDDLTGDDILYLHALGYGKTEVTVKSSESGVESTPEPASVSFLSSCVLAAILFAQKRRR